jgi:hypothetical protein
MVGGGAEMADEGGKHFADGGDIGKEVLELFRGDVREVEGDVQLGAKFACGAVGDVEKLQELAVGTPVETFGDVRNDGNGGTADLLAEAVVAGKFPLAGAGVHLPRQLSRLLPHLQIFESFDLCHRNRFQLSHHQSIKP